MPSDKINSFDMDKQNDPYSVFKNVPVIGADESMYSAIELGADLNTIVTPGTYRSPKEIDHTSKELLFENSPFFTIDKIYRDMENYRIDSSKYMQRPFTMVVMAGNYNPIIPMSVTEVNTPGTIFQFMICEEIVYNKVDETTGEIIEYDAEVPPTIFIRHGRCILDGGVHFSAFWPSITTDDDWWNNILDTIRTLMLYNYETGEDMFFTYPLRVVPFETPSPTSPNRVELSKNTTAGSNGTYITDYTSADTEEGYVRSQIKLDTTGLYFIDQDGKESAIYTTDSEPGLSSDVYQNVPIIGADESLYGTIELGADLNTIVTPGTYRSPKNIVPDTQEYAFINSPFYTIADIEYFPHHTQFYKYAHRPFTMVVIAGNYDPTEVMSVTEENKPGSIIQFILAEEVVYRKIDETTGSVTSTDLVPATIFIRYGSFNADGMWSFGYRWNDLKTSEDEWSDMRNAVDFLRYYNNYTGDDMCFTYPLRIVESSTDDEGFFTSSVTSPNRTELSKNTTVGSNGTYLADYTSTEEGDVTAQIKLNQTGLYFIDQNGNETPIIRYNSTPAQLSDVYQNVLMQAPSEDGFTYMNNPQGDLIEWITNTNESGNFSAGSDITSGFVDSVTGQAGFGRIYDCPTYGTHDRKLVYITVGDDTYFYGTTWGTWRLIPSMDPATNTFSRNSLNIQTTIKDKAYTGGISFENDEMLSITFSESSNIRKLSILNPNYSMDDSEFLEYAVSLYNGIPKHFQQGMPIHGEHNRPHGTYTGDGSTDRSINIGGIGSTALIVFGTVQIGISDTNDKSDFCALITINGGFFIIGGYNSQTSGQTYYFPQKNMVYAWGMLNLSESDSDYNSVVSYMNASSTIYYYIAL